MPKRVLLVVLIAVVTAAVAVARLGPQRAVPEGAPTEDEMADDVGAPIMENIFLGHVPGRSGEIAFLPRPHRYVVGEWDLTRLGTNDPDLYTAHSYAWDYLARVPIIFYGPSVRRGLDVRRDVDITDLAPTYARWVGMDYEADGEALDEVVPGRRATRPKVIFTVVIDGGGWNVLQEHPQSHPVIDGLRAQGTTYVNATIGSSPSITGALHANFGTGFYPVTHRLPGNQMRDPQGKGKEPGDPTIDTWLNNADPRYLEVPTMSELWDERNGNRPIVGTVAYEGWHLGMIGHGAQRDGGDKDIGVLWITEDNTWWINEDYYRLPNYLMPTDLETLEGYEERLDERDGISDGRWFGHTLEEIQDEKVRPGTSAFARFTGDAVAEILRREPIGEDGLTDLFWVELKPPDYGGHPWNMLGPEQADTIFEVDRQIGRFKRLLDRKVGRGNYLFVVTADHGQQPLPERVGGWRINSAELERDIEAAFGAPIVQKITPPEAFLDTQLMEEEGITSGDVARYIGAYTIGENIPEGRAGADRVPEGRLDERLFAGAFSTRYLAALEPDDIEGFGDSAYEEGDLTIDVAP